ncbi:YitT family protein [Niallia taxi]|uniref:YitT family protein n=1 Tax=Niallia taxi TaxID=2499688 RepID=UPI003D2683D0
MKQIKYYTSLVVGTLIISLSFTLLQGPNQIASGGLTGASLILSNILHLPSSLVLWGVTVFLLLACSYFLGIQSLMKSIVGSLLIPLFVYLTNGMPVLTNDPLLASIFGGLGVGIGLGIVFRAGGNTGGFTLIAQLLFQLKSVKHSTTVLCLDALVMIAGGIVFSPENALYALVGAYITRKTMDVIQGNKKGSKVAYIISSKEYEHVISNKVLHRLDRGLTKLTGSGGYTNTERIIMMIVLDPSKVNELKNLVQSIDHQAFIIMSDATEVFGEGFNSAGLSLGKG